MERRIQSLEDKFKAANSKKVKGNGTKLKSNLKKGTPIAKKTTAPKTTATPTKGQKGRGASNNNAKSGKQKSKGKGRKVLFSEKKGATNTNSRK
jgi:hypothetical protein